MKSIWELTDGFDIIPPNTNEYLYIDVEAPDYILSYTFGHGKSKDEFSKLGITSADVDDYVEGDHIFVINFFMQSDYPEKPMKNVRFTTESYLDMDSGTPYHIVLLVNGDRKKKRKATQALLIDQV